MKSTFIAAALMLAMAPSAFACKSPKFCKTSNGSSYQCGCNDAVPAADKARVGEKPTPPAAENNSSRGSVSKQ